MAVTETKAETQGLENTGETRRQGLIAFGGVLGGLAMSSCCILPLVLFSLGVTGAWIGNLAALYPYQAYFFVATAGLPAAVPGVKDVSVSFRNKTANVTFDGAQTNLAALTDATFEMGYPSEVKSQ